MFLIALVAQAALAAPHIDPDAIPFTFEVDEVRFNPPSSGWC